MAVGYEDVAYEVPKSRGMPPVVRWLFIIGLVIIFFMGAVSVIGSSENHVWPADRTPMESLSGKL